MVKIVRKERIAERLMKMEERRGEVVWSRKYMMMRQKQKRSAPMYQNHSKQMLSSWRFMKKNHTPISLQPAHSSTYCCTTCALWVFR
jgi:hypothetical protein